MVFFFIFFSATIMEGPEITFLFQFGSMRDAVTVCAPAITLKTLKDMACDFINSKVNIAQTVLR